MSFNQNFDQHSRWRREFSADLQRLADWLHALDLLDPAVSERIEHLRLRIRDEKVMVAFVAEFSRGKSELINAVFFAGYGRRIMPASAGRTTMCPTELGYDPEVPPSLRLLPIDTRLSQRSLLDWRDHPDDWTSVPLDVSDADSLALSMARVAEVERVSPERATALGFWQGEGGAADQSLVGDDGLVEVPKWRHALINIAHPLLRQGLIILDTPGLNAIGAEPELTVSLLPQAHAIVFILGADTGVTQSDLKIWREHLLPPQQGQDSRLVVLNKIDTLWDELSSKDAIQQQIRRQCESSAHILQLDPSRVLAVSAQKGLVAKINADAALLAASHLPDLELALVHGIVDQRRHLLQMSVAASVSDLVAQVSRLTQSRSRDLIEQYQELESLRGKNTSVIRHMRLRIEQEQHDFESGAPRVFAVRSVHIKLVQDLYDLLGEAAIRAEVASLIERLKQPGLKLGVRKTYELTFERLRQRLEQATSLASEIETMLDTSFDQLNAELGFSLLVTPAPDLSQFRTELDEVESSHLQFLGVSHMFKLAQPGFSDRLGRALLTRLRGVFESAATELELWNKSAASLLSGQIKDRRKNFTRRVEAVTRIQDAAGGLDERMAELKAQAAALREQRHQLKDMTATMLNPEDVAAESADSSFGDTAPSNLPTRATQSIAA
jgi:hypothetical protein